MKSKVLELKEKVNISESSIKVTLINGLDQFIIEFSIRRSWHELYEIFPLEYYDIWLLSGNESGGNDYLSHNSQTIGQAKYIFKQIMISSYEPIDEMLSEHFRSYVKTKHLSEYSYKIEIKGEYGSNSYYYDNGNELIIEEEPKIDNLLRKIDFSRIGESSFNTESEQIRFLNGIILAKFKDQYPEIKKIEFYYNGAIVNVFGDTYNKGKKFISQTCYDSFENCDNHEYTKNKVNGN